MTKRRIFLVDHPATTFVSAVILGIGATLTFDLWAMSLKYVFKIPPSDIRLVGRWVLYMREGVFTHSTIASRPPKNAERFVGWLAHYVIGVTLSIAFVSLVGVDWLRHPRLPAAVAFGLATVLAPFCIMQPSFGFGFAASKTAHPWQARLRSVMNHIAYGVGLYIFALLDGWLRLP